tara:strand:+ start:706 stop:1206 length:501 start_codon:yes stop_codon:yes gene_type:complete
MPGMSHGWLLGGGESGFTSSEWVPRLKHYEEGGAPMEATGLDELVTMSLFSWARADADDQKLTSTDGKRDRRGWWAESLGDDPGDRFGSRLWLLQRSKITPETEALALDYAFDSLRWLVDDGLADRVDVELYTVKNGVGLTVAITRGSGEVVELRYPSLWEAIINA